jgi:hypothetical protein
MQKASSVFMADHHQEWADHSILQKNIEERYAVGFPSSSARMELLL